MKQVRTYTELFKELEKQLLPIYQKALEHMKQILIDALNGLWFSRYQPALYERTGDLINSLSIKQLKNSNGKFEALIYFDKDKIRQEHADFGGGYPFNIHMSLDGSTEYGGIDIGNWILIWLNEGSNSPYWSFPETGWYDGSLRVMQEDHEVAQFITKELRKIGITATVSW